MTNVVQLVGDGARGGGTTYIVGLTAALIKHDYDLTVITDAGSFLANHAASLGASVIGLPFNARRNTPALALQLRRHLDRIDPAVVHAHGARAALPAALAGLSRSWKFVYTVHGLHFQAKTEPARSLGRLAERFCMQRSDHVVFVAGHDREVARKFGILPAAAHSEVIQNGVEVDIEPEQEANRLYDIGFLGRLVPQKNPLLLCDILLAMLPLRPTLQVIGGGPLESELRSRAAALGLAEQLTMTGELPRDEALRALARCRAFVLPSLNEGQPLAVMEAAHLGVPAVASAVAGTREIISDGVTGYLVPVDDVAGYADRLGRLLKDPDLAGGMSLAARNRAAADFCFQRIVDANLRIYALPKEDGPVHLHRTDGLAKAAG
nr:glycosyltransferase family 4 protein [uncultured Rhodopila sp.]